MPLILYTGLIDFFLRSCRLGKFVDLLGSRRIPGGNRIEWCSTGYFQSIWQILCDRRSRGEEGTREDMNGQIDIGIDFRGGEASFRYVSQLRR